MSATNTQHVELPITGMSCASCVARIEKKLNQLEGVDASVNFATETASIDYDAETVAPERLLEAVEAAGYQAALPAETGAGDGGGREQEEATAALRRRFVFG